MLNSEYRHSHKQNANHYHHNSRRSPAQAQEIANRLGVSLEALLLAGAENLLAPPETSFQNAMEYVLKKNVELYQKLA